MILTCGHLIFSKIISLEHHLNFLKWENVWRTLRYSCHLCFWVILENGGWKFRNLKSKISSSSIAVTITMKDSKYRNGLAFTCLGGLIYLTIILTQRVVLQQYALSSQIFSQRRYNVMASETISDVLKYLSHNFNALPLQHLLYLVLLV